MRKFKEDKEMYTKEYKESILNEGYYYSEAEAEKAADSHIKSMEKDCKLISQFEAFIGKIDTTCGGLIGDENGFIYEKVIKTEYKTELKPVESAGEIKNGQCFILKTSFNYGRSKGFVYRIHETEENGKKYYYAYKLNRKFTKECVGMANSNNYWFIGTDGIIILQNGLKRVLLRGVD